MGVHLCLESLAGNYSSARRGFLPCKPFSEGCAQSHASPILEEFTSILHGLHATPVQVPFQRALSTTLMQAPFQRDLHSNLMHPSVKRSFANPHASFFSERFVDNPHARPFQMGLHESPKDNLSETGLPCNTQGSNLKSLCYELYEMRWSSQ